MFAQPLHSGWAAIAQWLRTITVLLRNLKQCVRSHCAVWLRRHYAAGAQHYAVLLFSITQWVRSHYAVKHVYVIAA